jgi:hypothetical protein
MASRWQRALGVARRLLAAVPVAFEQDWVFRVASLGFGLTLLAMLGGYVLDRQFKDLKPAPWGESPVPPPPGVAAPPSRWSPPPLPGQVTPAPVLAPDGRVGTAPR